MKGVWLTALIGCTSLTSVAWGQSAVQQSGSVTVNTAPMWAGDHRLRRAAGSDGGNANEMITGGTSAVGDVCSFSSTLENSPNILCMDPGGFLKYNGTNYPLGGSGNVSGPTPSTIGNAVIWNNGVGSLVRDGGAPPGLALANNTALKGNIGGSTSARRLGFTTAGDGGAARYIWSSVNCPAADDGAQVQPTGTGCWIADFAGSIPTPKVWGAVGDGTTDDTVKVQNAITAMALTTAANAQKKLRITNNVYCVTALTIPTGVTIEGSGPPVAATETNSGLKACSANASLITVSGNGSKLSGLTLIGNGGNTSGFAIKITGNENRIENNHVNGFCTYLYNIGRHNIIDANVFTDNINPTDSHTCDALIDGDATAQTIGSIYTKNLFTAWGPSAAGAYHSGMLFQNSGGSYVAFNDIQRTGYGTMIKPLANKTTSFLLFDTTVLGDTTNADALIIDTAAASSKVEVINISNSYMGRNGDWPGTFTWASARNVTIQNSGAGLVLGVHIKGTQFNTTGNENLAIAGPVNDITVDNSMLCFPGQGVNSSNVTINTAGTIALRNNTIAAACDGTTFNGTTTNSNIHFLTNDPDNINITGNQFYGVWQSGNGPIDDAVSPVNTSALVMANNLPYDTVPLTLASAAVLQPLYYSQVIVTGVVGVTNIRHPWRGRTIQFYVQDGLTFTAGGGGTDPICANKAIAAGILATARFQAGPNCWAIQ